MDYDNADSIPLFGKEHAKTNGKDEIVVIVDRSGSMSSIKDDAQGGLNSFIKEQQKIGAASLTLVEFDDVINTVYDRVDLKEVKDYTLQPRGMTALFDGIGVALNNVVDTDGKKIAVIITDGFENSSKEYTKEQVFKRIAELKEKGWEFIFLAANQDAISSGGSLGIDASNSLNYANTSTGVRKAYAAANVYTSSIRSHKSKAEALSDLENYKKDNDEVF